MDFLDLNPLHTFVAELIACMLCSIMQHQKCSKNIFFFFCFSKKYTNNNILQIGCEICKIRKKSLNHSTLFRQGEAYKWCLRRDGWNNMPEIELSMSRCPRRLLSFHHYYYSLTKNLNIFVLALYNKEMLLYKCMDAFIDIQVPCCAFWCKNQLSTDY